MELRRKFPRPRRPPPHRNPFCLCFCNFLNLFFWVMELVQLSKFDCVVAHASFLFSSLSSLLLSLFVWLFALLLLCCSTSSHLLPISFCFFALVLLVLFFFPVAESCISCPNFSLYNSPYKTEGEKKAKRVVTTKGSDGGPSYKAWLLRQQTVEIV